MKIRKLQIKNRTLFAFIKKFVRISCSQTGGVMNTKEYVIKKVRSMPEEIVLQICDFIDFLERRRGKNQWEWFAQSLDSAKDDNFSEYLKGMEDYEDMLSNGKIRWK